ncbi:MAG TPA: hypothetical protein ENI52_06180 [Thermoplasmata archaeon]|nr:hypothetical protein [Thermoplasmata archaeon]
MICMDILEKAKKLMSNEPAFLNLKGKIMVAGDTHGDAVITKEIFRKFLNEKFNYLLFLGDYIDRAPVDVESSIININFLLEKKVQYPDKIFLLKGNHETNYAIPCYPHEFKEEAGELYEKYVGVFMEMPLMAMINNVFAAHGGFPLKKNLDEIDKNDVKVIEEITWSDPKISNLYRGAGYLFNKKDLDEFLHDIGARVFIRGHDYNLNGIVVYKKCLTIFSSRLYKHKGNKGILIAKVYGDIKNIKDIEIENYSDKKWKSYEVMHK